MKFLIGLAIIVTVIYLFKLIEKIYDRVSRNIIINSVNEEFYQLLIDNNHNLDYVQLDDFVTKHYDTVQDIDIDIDENNKFIYTLKFRDWL